jgi:alpha-N-arabinofuranosidase
VTLRARLDIEPEAIVAPVNRLTFGSFIEHMGRGVYTGVFEPGHPAADEHGLRLDVIELVRELGVTIVRYPGGNFVSGYRWEDGVGPLADRPVRLDPAWKSIEPNSFGLGEFALWSEKAGVEPMLALNLGTRGIQEALDLLEYSNHPGGTLVSDLRREHGRDRPYGIRTWCLGNEMDGPWQMGHKTAEEYGRLATETARAMRMVDPTLKLVLCGSSGRSMPGFGTWERTVLEHAYEQVDLISAHAYYEPSPLDPASFLASATAMEAVIEEVTGIADEIGRRKGTSKQIDLSFDEWNVWYQSRLQDGDGEWRHAPRLSEDDYTVADAVVVGSLLLTLLRHNDRVGIACQAQLVNTIAPIRTEPGGPAWRQAIFHPFALTARYAVGSVLGASPSGPTVETARYGEVPIVDALATHDNETGSLTVLAVNRSIAEPVELTVDVSPLSGGEVVEMVVLSVEDPGAVNTLRHPDRVLPRPGQWRVAGKDIVLVLPPVSWSMLRISTG